MNPLLVVSAFISSFEAQLTAHIVGNFAHGPTLASLSPEQLAAVRELVLQAARNAAGPIAMDADEAVENARAA
jgi:hypothetical protein